MNEDTKILMYLLKILGPSGRQFLKDEMLERVTHEPKAGKLLNAINKIEMALGQLDRMSEEERMRKGLPPRPKPELNERTPEGGD